MRLGKLSIGIASMALVACGGDGGPRPDQNPDPSLPEDTGGGSFACPEPGPADSWIFTDWAGRELSYSFSSIEDWEFGAGMGWYTNNPQCSHCEELERSCDGVAIDNPIYAANQICSPAADAAVPVTPVDPAVLAACWDQCRDLQQPTYFEKPLPAERIPFGGRCSSQYALHMTVGPYDTVPFKFNQSWGGVIGLQGTRDASEWDGISFWARVGPGSRTPLHLEVSDPYTDSKADPPRCDSITELDDTALGCDKFGADVLMGDTWRFFAIPFGEMRQGGWGVSAPYLDIAHLLSIGFAYDVGVWDFWIDDIAFYRHD
jgi:hypothetical protein